MRGGGGSLRGGWCGEDWEVMIWGMVWGVLWGMEGVLVGGMTWERERRSGRMISCLVLRRWIWGRILCGVPVRRLPGLRRREGARRPPQTYLRRRIVRKRM